MLPEFTPTEYSARWQQVIASSLEAGQSPALHFGRNVLLLDQLQALLALQMLATERSDLTTPAIIAAGVTPLWVAALLLPTSAAPPVPALRVIYGGADPATVLASRTLYADGDRPLRRHAYVAPPASLPAALVPPLAPRVEPLPAFPWSTQPFWEIDRAQAPRFMPARGEDWLAYLTIMLAVVLFLAALVASIPL